MTISSRPTPDFLASVPTAVALPNWCYPHPCLPRWQWRRGWYSPFRAPAIPLLPVPQLPTSAGSSPAMLPFRFRRYGSTISMISGAVKQSGLPPSPERHLSMKLSSPSRRESVPEPWNSGRLASPRPSRTKASYAARAFETDLPNWASTQSVVSQGRGSLPRQARWLLHGYSSGVLTMPERTGLRWI